MRKFTLFLVLIGMISLNSCTTEEYYITDDINDQDTISEVWEYTNINFHSGNDYSVMLNFPYSTYDSDMILIYRLSAYSSSTGDVWKLLPETYYFTDGTVDFGYANDFTTYNAQITMFGYDLGGLNASVTLDQIFRVVVIPGYFANKTAESQVDFNDYQAVVDYYQLNQINKIK